jgi:RNA polymerase sigma-70 factor (ECF subfamily)
MIHNKCLNQVRDQKIHDRYTNYTELKLKEAEILFYDEDPESYKSIFFLEIEQIVKKSILDLPEGCREIIVLSRMEGLSNKEIAGKLAISVRTVENQIYRALKILKENLKEYLSLLPFLLIRFL